MLQFSTKAKSQPARRAQTGSGQRVLGSGSHRPRLLHRTEHAPGARPAASIKRLFARQDKAGSGNTAQHADAHEAVQMLAAEIKQMGQSFTKVTTALESIASRVDAIQTEQTKDKAEFSSLKQTLESTETTAAAPLPPAAAATPTSRPTADHYPPEPLHAQQDSPPVRGI
jgi:hypothetical protein